MRVTVAQLAFRAHDEADRQVLRRAVDLHADDIAGMQVMLACELFTDGDCSRVAQPFLQIETLVSKIGQLKGAKRFVGKDVDPEQVQIFAGIFREGDEAPNDRRRRRHARLPGDLREETIGQVAGRRVDFELRLSRDDIDRRLESAVGTLVGSLNREIERDAECNRQNVKDREQRVPREIAEDVPTEETGMLRDQVAASEDAKNSSCSELCDRCAMESNTRPIFAPVILGTPRQGRASESVARFVFEEVSRRPDVETELIDIRNIRLSLDDAGEALKDSQFSATVGRADALLLVVPEYNHSFPGLLKHVLDTNLKEYIHKAVGVCGVSAGPFGGARMIQNLLPVLRELGLVAIFEDVYFGQAGKLFDPAGKITDPSYSRRLAKFADELVWMARALRFARENLPVA